MSDDFTKLNGWSKLVKVRDHLRDMSNEVNKSKEGWNLIERGEVKGS